MNFERNNIQMDRYVIIPVPEMEIAEGRFSEPVVMEEIHLRGTEFLSDFVSSCFLLEHCAKEGEE